MLNLLVRKETARLLKVKHRLMQIYVNTHKFVFIASDYKNATLFTATHFSVLLLSSFLTYEVVR